MRDDDKLKFTFTVDPHNAGLLIIAALKLEATIDQCVWEQLLSYSQNIPQAKPVLRLPHSKGSKRPVGRPRTVVGKKYPVSTRTNGASLNACLARLKEAGDKGVEWNELKKIYNDNGALPQGLNSALKALGTKRGTKLFLRSDARIHGKAVG